MLFVTVSSIEMDNSMKTGIGLICLIAGIFALASSAQSESIVPASSDTVSNPKEYREEQATAGESAVSQMNVVAEMKNGQNYEAVVPPAEPPVLKDTWQLRLAKAAEKNRVVIEPQDTNGNRLIDLLILDTLDSDGKVASSERWHINEDDDTVSSAERN